MKKSLIGLFLVAATLLLLQYGIQTSAEASGKKRPRRKALSEEQSAEIQAKRIEAARLGELRKFGVIKLADGLLEVRKCEFLGYVLTHDKLAAALKAVNAADYQVRDSVVHTRSGDTVTVFLFVE